MKQKDPMFLIIAGAIMALFLPFAAAFPPTLLEKVLAIAALAAASLGVAWLVRRKKSGSDPD